MPYAFRVFPAVMVTLVAVLFAPSSAVAAPKDDQPNIVFIYIDDLGWSDVGFHGTTFYETPHLDRLAARGMRFSNAYANAPNCAPSRASLLSGLYPPRHGVFTVGDPWRGPRETRRLVPAENTTTLAPEVFTLAEALQEAGYAAAHMGKWHLGEPGEAGPKEQGFDVNIGGTHAGHPPTYFSPYRIGTLEDGRPGEYLTDRLTDEALGFIEKHQDEPFFLYLSHYAVHTPIEGEEEIAERYENKPAWHGQENAEYAAMIESVDRGVGQIVEKLERLGLTSETVIVFSSDNGGLGGYASAGVEHSRAVTDNHPLKGGKGQLYEGGIRVPTFVVWPGVTEVGTVSDVPTIGVDVYPTLLEMADVEPRPGQVLDGESLVPLLRGGDLEREALYWFFPAYLQAYGPGGLRTAPAAAIRRGSDKLIWFFEDDRLELYNLASDVGERHDLAGAQPEKAAALHARLKAWIERVEAPMPRPNPDYDPASGGE